MTNYPSYKISTMTYICKFSDIVDTKTFYEANVNKNIDSELYIENKSTKIDKKGKFVKSFGNQITIKSKSKKYNIKIFSNGKIQMTGIKDTEDTCYIERKLINIFNTNVVDKIMVMMNVTFKISSRPVHLYDLFDILENDGKMVFYTPEIYPGLKLKYNNK